MTRQFDQRWNEGEKECVKKEGRKTKQYQTGGKNEKAPFPAFIS